MQAGKYGGRTTVTALVRRGNIASLCARLHNLLGVEVGERTDRVFLPADTRSFGLVAGGAGKAAQGVIENLPKDAFELEPVGTEELWVIPISHLGAYFGWSSPHGVRVQFHTQTGENYAVTITYDVLPGHQEAQRFFPLIQALLEAGVHSVAMNLTEKAAAKWGSKPSLKLLQRLLLELKVRLKLVQPPLYFDEVQLVDPPPRERISHKSGPAARPAGRQRAQLEGADD